MKPSSIENRIIELKQEIANKPKELGKRLEAVGVSQRQLDSLIEKDNKSLKEELEGLEIQRQFILDRRNGWKPKVIWDMLVPIIVAVVTSYIVAAFLSGS